LDATTSHDPCVRIIRWQRVLLLCGANNSYCRCVCEVVQMTRASRKPHYETSNVYSTPCLSVNVPPRREPWYLGRYIAGLQAGRSGF
jgi:hypothetical protein